MNSLSKMPLKICFLLGCCAVLLSTCENPQPNTEQLLAPHPEGDTTPVTCEVSNTEPSASPHLEGRIIDPTKEPRYKEQWYLNNAGEIHINIAPVWQKGYGTKVVAVGILDQTIDTAHPDLAGSTCGKGFVPYNPKESHGTNVAGLIAARDNGKGIIGVAPRARIYSYGVLGRDDPSDYVVKALESPEHKTIAVYNASIGHASRGATYFALPDSLKEAMDRVVEHGFNGKGTGLVFSAGNDGLTGNTANTSYFRHYAVIAVNTIFPTGRIPDRWPEGPLPLILSSTIGVNVWIAAPAGGAKTRRMITTDNGGGYKEDFGQTSGAAPLVSGAIALLRSEYPELTWRDVKLIVAESAKKHDYEERARYRTTGTMYSDNSKPQWHSRTMGFGLLDVDAMFALTEDWKLLPDMKERTYTQPTPHTITSHTKYTSTLTVTGSDIQFIESVTLTMNIEKTKEVVVGLQFWALRLIGPNGTKASIYDDIKEVLRENAWISDNTLTFVVNSFLGSAANGTWKLEIQQNQNDIINKIASWSITFRGH